MASLMLGAKANMAIFGRLQKRIVFMLGTSDSIKMKVGSVKIVRAGLCQFALFSNNFFQI
jgi:hypothetical protein